MDIKYKLGPKRVPEYWDQTLIFRARRPLPFIVDGYFYSGDPQAAVMTVMGQDQLRADSLLSATGRHEHIIDLERAPGPRDTHLLRYRVTFGDSMAAPKEFFNWGLRRPKISCERAILRLQFHLDDLPATVMQSEAQVLTPDLADRLSDPLPAANDGYYERVETSISDGISYGFHWNW
jgi:hypothetical protein